MADLAAIRAGFQAALATVTGVTGYTYWPSTCDSCLPAAMAMPGRMTFHEDFSESLALLFEIHLLAAWASEGFEDGQEVLDGYLADTGASSVKAALEADPTLGGTVESLSVLRWRDYGFGHRMAPNGPPAWGAVFDVEVYA